MNLCSSIIDAFQDDRLKTDDDMENIYKKIEKEVGIEMVN